MSTVLRMSTLFVRTLRDDPADAEVPSHRLLVRAGYIRRAAPGHLHLAAARACGCCARSRTIVREEMDAIGAQELLFPALLPREPYEATGRWTEYGDSIFRLKDRKGADYLLGPTHEEMFTLVVKDLYSSYKDLPLSIYQIQTKYRDEARPRAGLLRGREFVMKDSYSFDIDDAGLDASYQRTATPTSGSSTGSASTTSSSRPMSGAMGGSKSEEFLATAEVGEDTYVRCTHCDYAANVEAVAGAARPPPSPYDDAPAAHAEQTPDTPTIDTLVDHLNETFPRDDRPWAAGDTLKNVLVVLKHPDGTREPLAIGVPGDREVDQKRLEAPARADRGRAVRRGRLRRAPGAGQGLHRPRRAGREERRPASATCSTRASSRAPAGSPAPTSPAATSSTSSPAATSPPTAPSRPPRSATATPARTATTATPRVRPRHRDGPHLPARPQVRRRARPPGARRERQAGHGHDGLLRHRPLPRRRRDRRGHPRRARPVLAARGRPGRRAPRRRPARTRRSSRPPSGSPPSSSRAGRRRALRRPAARSAPA